VGLGTAPPGLIFVTQEAFLTRARAATLDEPSTFIAEQVSRGINERVAHEVAHAWFPHVAKIDRWEENWLSESLADYTSAACLSQLDNRGGKARFSRQLSEWKYLAGQLSASASIYLASHLGSREVDWRDQQSLLYARGPLVLHAIRQELARVGGNQQEGDRLFFAWLRSYIKNFTFRTAETRHLIGILNQITKKDWQPWFERHVYGAEAVPLD
jgi:aminopeptidase N